MLVPCEPGYDVQKPGPTHQDVSRKMRCMAELDDIYSNRILELASDIPRSTRLDTPDATARAQSKLCGSTIEVDLSMQDGLITDFGQTVKACLLGQAAASVVGREIVGTSIGEFQAVSHAMRAMLNGTGDLPEGRWSDLATLAPVKDYPHRHASTMLVFDAVLSAIEQITTGTTPSLSGARAKAAGVQ